MCRSLFDHLPLTYSNRTSAVGQRTAVKAFTRLIRKYDLDHAQDACITGKDHHPGERQQGQRYYDCQDTPATGLTGLARYSF